MKGATAQIADEALNPIISIHAPVKGATGALTTSEQSVVISIHAPVKGATYYVSLDSRVIVNFNPRSREGSDTSPDPKTGDTSQFQSTLP